MRKIPKHTAAAAVLTTGLLLLAACGEETPGISGGEIDARAARNLEAHLMFLADDALQGRKPGTDGYRAAANYVAGQFRMMGLQPAGDDGSYFQQVPLRFSRRAETGNTLTVNDTALTLNEDFVTGGNTRTGAAEVSGGLVFVGFGIHSPEHGIDDYAGLDMEGKIAVRFLGGPPTLPGEVRAHLSNTAPAEAAKRGAIGMINIYTTAFESVIPWQRLVPLSERPSAAWLEADGSAHTSAPGLRASALLNPAVTEMIFEGAEKTYEEVRAEAETGPVRGFALPATAAITQSSIHDDFESPNVVAMIEGSDPELREEYVILTAHLDHDGVREPDAQGDAIYNGAADNASGVAVMLEVARSIAMSGAVPRRSLVFTIVTAEESGLLGADYFAHHSTVPAENIVANINSDAALFFFDFPDLLIFGKDHSTLGDTAVEVASGMGLGQSEDPMPEQGFFTRSDHYPFVVKGVPALFTLVGLGTNEEGVSGMDMLGMYLSNHYHQPSDDMDLPWDYEAGAKFVRYLTVLATRVANDDARPAWHEDSFFAHLNRGETAH